VKNTFRIIAAAAILGLGFGGFALSQAYNFVIRAGLPNTPSISLDVDAANGIYGGVGYIGVSKHLASGNGGAAPALSTCGTSPALAAGSTDLAGKITVGTSASNACTLTFGVAFNVAPFCVFQNMTTGAAANVATVIAATIIWSSALADSTVITYHCIAGLSG